MNRITKIVAFLFTGLIFISSCNDKGTDSPFSDILDNAPYLVYTDSIKQFPKNDELYFRRGVLLNSNNLPEPALEDFKTAWQIKKDERYAYGFGNLLLDKKPDSAILFLNNAINRITQ